MTIGTRLFTWLKGEVVGTDAFGNRYFQEKRPASGYPARRWVIYKGASEASKVAAEWHGWLHHTVVAPPTAGAAAQRPWQKEHLPNLTGTEFAYRPPGYTLKGGKRSKATGDYEPWRPS
jgi:NADH:ubiquinone oxidoreductase subunit